METEGRNASRRAGAREYVRPWFKPKRGVMRAGEVFGEEEGWSLRIRGSGGIVEQEMREASSKLEFERAAHLRDQIATLKNATPVMPPQKKVKYSGKKKSKRSQ